MIIFLYGPDSYRRQKALERIIESHRVQGALVARFEFDEVSTAIEAQEKLNQLCEFTKSSSLFGEKRVAVIRGLFAWELPTAKEFLKTAVKAKDYAAIVSEVEAGSVEYPFLRGKSAEHQKFEFFKDAALFGFIEKEAHNRGVKFSPGALRALAHLANGDSWFIVTELEKIALFPAAQQRKIVDTADLETVADYRESPNLFAFINGIERLSSSAKLAQLEYLMLSHEEPAKIFNILAAGRYLSRELVLRLADYDIAVKSGKLEYEEVLLDLALL